MPPSLCNMKHLLSICQHAPAMAEGQSQNSVSHDKSCLPHPWERSYSKGSLKAATKGGLQASRPLVYS